MADLTIVASIHAKPDEIDLVKAELLRLIEVTRAEEGCLQYDLHQDNENPAHLMFCETWESRKLRREHTNASHIGCYAAATRGSVDACVLNEMTRIT